MHRYVVVGTKNVTRIPGYFTTSFPRCPPAMTLAQCTTELGDGYSVFKVAPQGSSASSAEAEYGYMEVVSAPLMLYSEPGLKAPAFRHLLRNVTLPYFEAGLIPLICHSDAHCLRVANLVHPEAGDAPLHPPQHRREFKALEQILLRGATEGAEKGPRDGRREGA